MKSETTVTVRLVAETRQFRREMRQFRREMRKVRRDIRATRRADVGLLWSWAGVWAVAVVWFGCGYFIAGLVAHR